MAHVKHTSIYTRRQTAAELFASSLLDSCQTIKFVRVEATPLGFNVDIVAPFEIQEQHIQVALDAVRAKIKSGVEIRDLEMSTKNALEYMKHQKQNFRHDAIEKANTFTQMIQIGDYANVAHGAVFESANEVGELAIGEVTDGGEVLYHKKPVSVQRIIGFAEETKGELKDQIKRVRRAKDLESRAYKRYFGVDCWKGEAFSYLETIWTDVRKCFLDTGFKEVRLVGDLAYDQIGKKVFERVDVDCDEMGAFGLKDCQMQGAVRGFVQKNLLGMKSLLQMIEKLGTLSAQIINDNERRIYLVSKDAYEIDWIIGQCDEGKDGIEFSIWIDRIALLGLESRLKKELLKKPPV